MANKYGLNPDGSPQTIFDKAKDMAGDTQAGAQAVVNSLRGAVQHLRTGDYNPLKPINDALKGK